MAPSVGHLYCTIGWRFLFRPLGYVFPRPACISVSCYFVLPLPLKIWFGIRQRSPPANSRTLVCPSVPYRLFTVFVFCTTDSSLQLLPFCFWFPTTFLWLASVWVMLTGDLACYPHRSWPHVLNDPPRLKGRKAHSLTHSFQGCASRIVSYLGNRLS